MSVSPLIPKEEAYLLKLNSPYPEPNVFLKILRKTSRIGREVLTGLFLTEGIPKAFEDYPCIYEFLRRWLAEKLNINTKQVTLLGSARIGYSLSPNKFGKEFGSGSDLDLSIMSKDIFEKLRVEALRFIDDYKNGRIIPSEAKRKFWPENVKFLKRNLPKGFIDVNKIPYIKERYPTCQSLGNLMWLLTEKVNATSNAPNIKKVSLRIYDKWDSLIERVSFNLLCLSKKNTLHF